MIYNSKSLSKHFVLQGIYQGTGIDSAMGYTANMAWETKSW